MKKIKLLVITLIAWGLCLTQAQQLERAYSIQTGKYDKTLQKWNWTKAEDVNLRFTFDNNYIRINDEYGTKVYTYEDEGETTGYDSDGDKYSRRVWKAFDEKNRRCRFIMLWYTGIKLVTYTILYNDYAFRYFISTEPEL